MAGIIKTRQFNGELYKTVGSHFCLYSYLSRNSTGSLTPTHVFTEVCVCHVSCVCTCVASSHHIKQTFNHQRGSACVCGVTVTCCWATPGNNCQRGQNHLPYTPLLVMPRWEVGILFCKLRVCDTLSVSLGFFQSHSFCASLNLCPAHYLLL